jgi:hypothetical protein
VLSGDRRGWRRVSENKNIHVIGPYILKPTIPGFREASLIHEIREIRFT